MTKRPLKVELEGPRRGAVGAVLLALVVAAGGGCAKQPTTVTFADLCNPANDGRLVTTDGYLAIGGSVLRTTNLAGKPAWSLRLSATPATSTEAAGDVGAYIAEGGKPNQMDPLPSGYDLDDLHVRTDDGAVVGGRDHVRVTGKALIGADTCTVHVDEVRKA